MQLAIDFIKSQISDPVFIEIENLSGMEEFLLRLCGVCVCVFN